MSIGIYRLYRISQGYTGFGVENCQNDNTGRKERGTLQFLGSLTSQESKALAWSVILILSASYSAADACTLTTHDSALLTEIFYQAQKLSYRLFMDSVGSATYPLSYVPP